MTTEMELKELCMIYDVGSIDDLQQFCIEQINLADDLENRNTALVEYEILTPSTISELEAEIDYFTTITDYYEDILHKIEVYRSSSNK